MGIGVKLMWKAEYTVHVAHVEIPVSVGWCQAYGEVTALYVYGQCSLSMWRVVRGSKLMHLELIHGLFIT
jgi:hypothetical protein